MAIQDSSKDEILQAYDLYEPFYKAMSESVRRLIDEFLKTEKIRALSITHRVKERASLAEKLSRPKKQYKVISDITDIVGVRIVTFFEDDVDRVASVIAREFKLKEEHCIDKRNAIEPDRFGYKSLHYVCELSDIRKELIENSSFKYQLIEVQIRSVLQHAWAEIEHDLGYKGTVLLPDQIKRQLSRVAGLLEIADRDFREVRDSSIAYRERVTQDIKLNSISQIDLDTISYQQFVENSPLIGELSESFRQRGFGVFTDTNPETTIRMLAICGITSVESLSTALGKRLQFLKTYAELLFPGTDESLYSALPEGISLFHLSQMLAFESGGIPKLVQLHEAFGIMSSSGGTVEEGATEIGQRFLAAGLTPG